MSEGLKQRIIGTIVLGILGFTLLPLIIDFSDAEKIDRSSKIPPAPEINPVTIEKAKRPESLKIRSGFESLCRTSNLKPGNLEGDSYGISSNNLPLIWYLQVGSFRDVEKAKTLELNLSKAGYKVFAETLSADGGPRERISVIGPKLDRRTVIDAKDVIDKQFGIDSIILSCEPQ